MHEAMMEAVWVRMLEEQCKTNTLLIELIKIMKGDD
jgi:hypothetical protein